MAQITSGVRSILSRPVVYTVLQNIMGARAARVEFVRDFVRPRPGAAVLDVGCGPGDLLEFLPKSVEYWGFDISPQYIARARHRFGDRGRFQCKLLTREELTLLPQFDVVIASGLLHHLDDDVAEQLLRLSHEALISGGRLVTIDPCLVPGQNPLARYLIKHDRGQNVRTEEGYKDLAARVFPRHDVLVKHRSWIPYTHCYTECTKA